MNESDLEVIEETDQELKVEPKKVIYVVPKEVAVWTNKFRSKPSQTEMVTFIELYRANIEFDL
jgi:hypothetical protein